MKAAPQRNPVLEPGREASLVRAAQGGDQAAFAEIVRHFQRPVYRVAYALTRNPSDADDLAQETFVRAYQAIGRFRAGEPLYPWLSRITVNLTYSLFRQRKRRPETSIEPLLETGRQWAGADDPAERAAESDQHERLAAAFAELSHEHQAVLTLRVVEGLSYDDIARALGVPPGTVMSRLSRARADLRTRFQARTGERP
jgi:RNA polymerase sigma-70 factor (ECF subfamily)